MEECCSACGSFYTPCACDDVGDAISQLGRLAGELLAATVDLRAAQQRSERLERAEAEAAAILERLVSVHARPGACSDEEAWTRAKRYLARRDDIEFNEVQS